MEEASLELVRRNAFKNARDGIHEHYTGDKKTKLKNKMNALSLN